MLLYWPYSGEIHVDPESTRMSFSVMVQGLLQ
jgi:hypothetical protein